MSQPTAPVVAENVDNSVADVGIAFPPEWEGALRHVSPINTIHSHLRPYYYRAKDRWVLYDCLPAELIPTDDTPINAMGLTGREFFRSVMGRAPWDLPDWEVGPVSGVQFEMFRRWRVYACPYWVLQGPNGGHQYRFSPIQRQLLVELGLPDVPPFIGMLAPAPFDQRAVDQLQRSNILQQLDGSIDRLRARGTPESAFAEMEVAQREVRLQQSRFLEEQMTPIVDMVMSQVAGVRPRSENADQYIRVAPGKAAEAKDAYQRYLETGEHTMRDFTGH